MCFLVTGKGTNVTFKTWKVPCSEVELDFLTIHEFQYKTASPLMKLDAFLQTMFGKSRIWINSKQLNVKTKTHNECYNKFVDKRIIIFIKSTLETSNQAFLILNTCLKMNLRDGY